MKRKKLISLLLAFFSIVVLFCGCTNNNGAISKGKIKFRDIPFGTGRITTTKSIEEGLKKQGHSVNQYNIASTSSGLIYYKIPLYDYTATMEISFASPDSVYDFYSDNALLYYGRYIIKVKSTEEQDDCFEFFRKEINNKYKLKEEAVTTYEVSWFDGSTQLWIEKRNENNKYVTINYLNQGVKEYVKKESEVTANQQKEKQNSGL